MSVKSILYKIAWAPRSISAIRPKKTWMFSYRAQANNIHAGSSELLVGGHVILSEVLCPGTKSNLIKIYLSISFRNV